jgi:hypothetical protein
MPFDDNVNVLNSPIKRHRFVDWIEKKKTKPKDKRSLKGKEGKKIFQAKCNPKATSIAIPTSHSACLIPKFGEMRQRMSFHTAKVYNQSRGQNHYNRTH